MVKKKNMVKAAGAVLAAGALVSALFVCGCSSSNSSQQSSSSDSSSAKSSSTTSAPSVNSETEKIKVGLFEGSYLSVPVLVARDKGYFAEEGLDVDWQSVSTDGTTSVMSGDLDVYCTGYSTALSAIAQGDTTVQIIGGEMSEGCDYVAKQDFKLDKISSAADFSGLKVGVCMGDPGYYMTKAACTDAGVTDVSFVELDSIGTTVSAVEKGEVDLSIVCGAMSYDMLGSGCKVLAKVSDFTGTFPCCRLQANSTFIQNNASALQKFMTAALRGYQSYKDDPDGTSQILAKVSGMDAAAVKARMYGSDGYDTPMAVSIDPEANAVIAADKAFKTAGSVPQSDVKVADFIYTDAYKNALQSLIDKEPSTTLWSDLMTQFKTKNSEVLK